MKALLLPAAALALLAGCSSYGDPFYPAAGSGPFGYYGSQSQTLPFGYYGVIQNNGYPYGSGVYQSGAYPYGAYPYGAYPSNAYPPAAYVYPQAQQRVIRNRDIDGDGIRNRRDADIDGDGVRNRRDADRDGDGVPNNVDARPNNPSRR